MKCLAAFLVAAAILLTGEVLPVTSLSDAGGCCCDGCAQTAPPSDCGCPVESPCVKLPVMDAVVSTSLPPPLSPGRSFGIPVDESSNSRSDRPPTPPPRVAA
ncbi:MAG: hypothetical protein NTV93_16225 [Verrucomicrobia bacterium]|nr:hypothetical protein [Verrucomicrobiota bacterium]